MKLQNIIMQLRKACNHPYLLLENIETIPDELYYKYVIQSSGKLFQLEKILIVLLSLKHKILIFSQFTSTLDIIHGYIQSIG